MAAVMALARTPMRRKPARHPVPAGVRDAVFARARGRCEACSAPLLDTWELAHRQARGMGGGSDPRMHAPSNLLALCRKSHRAATLNPRWAETLGLMVRHGVDPATVAARVWDRGAVLLTDDYQYAEVP